MRSILVKKSVLYNKTAYRQVYIPTYTFVSATSKIALAVCGSVILYNVYKFKNIPKSVPKSIPDSTLDDEEEVVGRTSEYLLVDRNDGGLYYIYPDDKEYGKLLEKYEQNNAKDLI